MLGLFVYFTIYTSLFLLARKSVLLANYKDRNIWQLRQSYLIIAIFAIIVGLRYDVGRDWMAYHDLLTGDVPYWSYDRLEPMNRWSIFFVQNSKLHYCVWFIFMAAVQIYFVTATFGRRMVALLPLGLFCFLNYELSFDMNVVRQGCALSIMLYAYTFIAEKDWKRFIFWVIVAYLFHKTAIVFLPLYFMGLIDRIPSVKMQITFFLLLMFLGTTVIQWLIGLTGSYWDLLSYGQKIDQLAEREWEIQSGMGLGVLFTNVRRFAIILFSAKLMDRYKNEGFATFYNIFFIGACMYSATMSDMLLERMWRYLSICDIVVSAYFFHYLIKVNKQNATIGYVLLLGLVVIAAYEVAFGSPWQFIQFF